MTTNTKDKRVLDTVKPDRNIEFIDDRDYDRRKSDRIGDMNINRNYNGIDRRRRKRRATD